MVEVYINSTELPIPPRPTTSPPTPNIAFVLVFALVFVVVVVVVVVLLFFNIKLV